MSDRETAWSALIAVLAGSFLGAFWLVDPNASSLRHFVQNANAPGRANRFRATVMTSSLFLLTAAFAVNVRFLTSRASVLLRARWLDRRA